MIDVRRLQVRREKALADDLAGRQDVKKGVAKIHEMWSGRGFGPRRELLTHSLRLTRSMSPEIADSVARCRDLVGLDRPVELYVRPEPMFQATCMKNPAGPLVIVLSSRLVEAFSPEELQFVIGHEIGHAVFDHFRLPMPALTVIERAAVPLVSRPVALQLYAWARAAELSADRVGLVCAQDPDAAASGFFKLASGTSSPRVRPDLATYAAQVAALGSVPLARDKEYDASRDDLDCFSTHPYSPVRVRAIYAFSQSAGYQAAVGRGAGALTDDQLEQMILRDLELMEPGYLEEKNEQSDLLRRLLFTAGAVIAAANGKVEDSEVEALGTLLGNDEVEHLAQRVETARKDLDGRIKAVLEANVPLVRRGQLLQHLTIIAGADGSVDDPELAELRRIADKLGVDFSVVAHTLAAASAPID